MKHLILAALLILSINSFAQSTPDDAGDGEGIVPIDGGLSLLAAAGVAYGASRRNKSRENA